MGQKAQTDVEVVMRRQRNSRNLNTENSQISRTAEQEKYLKDRLEAEKNLARNEKLKRHDLEMELLRKVIARIKNEKRICSNCTKKSIRNIRQRIKNIRKELGMPLFGIPGREY